MTVWIARDWNEVPYLFEDKPIWYSDTNTYAPAGSGGCFRIAFEMFPEVKPGECKQYKLVPVEDET